MLPNASLVSLEVSIAEQDLGKVQFGDGGQAFRELVKLDLENLSLKILHKPVQ